MQHSIENNSIKDAYFVHAVAGDKVIIPPNYGHFTINAGSKDLAMANWVCLDCVSDYSEVKEKRGACYFAVKNPPSPLLQRGNVEWLSNKNYREVSKLRELNPTNFSEFGLEKNKEMYELVDDLEKLDFLVKP